MDDRIEPFTIDPDPGEGGKILAMKLILVIASFVFLFGCKSKDFEKASEEAPLKIVCKNDKGRVILQATVKSASKMTTEDGLKVIDMNDKEMIARGDCEIAD